MNKIDPEAERQRLAHLYSQMTVEELEKLINEANGLTDIARSVLQAEIESRGSEVDFEKSPAGEDIDHPQLFTIALIRDLDEAMIARGRLASAGIECFIADENLVSLNWFMSNVIGNLRLQVSEEDAESAKEILSEPIPEKFSVGEGEEQFEQPRCPKCNSLDIQFEGVNRGVALTAAWFIKVPIPLRRNVWKCNDCGAQWQDLEDSTEAADEEQTFDS